VIEGVETHTRTGFVDVTLPDPAGSGGGAEKSFSIPVTHVKVFGWYDNELGSYTHRLGQLTSYIASTI